MATRTIVKYRTRAKPKRNRRKAHMTIPLAVIGGFAPLVVNTVGGYRNGGMTEASRRVLKGLSGYDYRNGQWSPSYAMAWGLGPIVGGMLVHKLAGRLGINRMLAQAGIPLVRI